MPHISEFAGLLLRKRILRCIICIDTDCSLIANEWHIRINAVTGLAMSSQLPKDLGSVSITVCSVLAPVLLPLSTWRPSGRRLSAQSHHPGQR